MTTTTPPESSSESALAKQIAPMKRAMSFAKKVILVTGGTSGIGFATAAAFAKCGAKVVIAARDTPQHPGPRAAQSLSVMTLGDGGRVVFRRVDVTDPADVRGLIEWIWATFDRFDVAVHSHGVAGFTGPISELQAKHLSDPSADPIRTNLYGTLNCIREEVAAWRTKHIPGIIVNVASTHGLMGCPNSALFSAAAHGIIGLTRSVAQENLGPPRIRVNAVAPAPCDTPLSWNQVKLPVEQAWEGHFIASRDDPMWRENRDGFLRLPPRLKGVPGERLLSPADVAGTILFLASDIASSVTGTVVPVDNSASSGWNGPWSSQQLELHEFAEIQLWPK